jgi:hypothetical protein
MTLDDDNSTLPMSVDGRLHLLEAQIEESTQKLRSLAANSRHYGEMRQVAERILKLLDEIDGLLTTKGEG